MLQVTIHEFSTGINVEIYPDGSWLSRGFTSDYMNATLSPIPNSIREAIANELFALVEGKQTEDPAVIGREVYDPQQNQWWSVVALVNKGQDEKGRPISVTRYFLTQGKGNLWQILAWMKQVQQQTGKLPIFNPSDIKNVSQPMTVNVDYPETKSLPDNLRNSQVVLLKDEYTLQDINYCVQQKTQEDTPITWAVNIEALKKPEDFTLIQVANLEAFKSIKSHLANIQISSISEQQIRTAIKSLIYGDVKEQAVKIIAQGLEDEEITSQIWHKHFNAEGAEKGINLGIFSPQMVKLLTLRSIVLPKTFPDLFIWLKSDKNQRYISISTELFNQFLKEVPSQKIDLVENHFIIGIESLLLQDLGNKLTPEEVAEILNNKYSILTHLLNSKILVEIERKFQKNPPSKNEAKRLAKIFEILTLQELSAFCYQISQDFVPTKIFNQAFGKNVKDEQYLGISLKRELSFKHKIFKITLTSISKSIFFVVSSPLKLLKTVQSLKNTTIDKHKIIFLIRAFGIVIIIFILIPVIYGIFIELNKMIDKHLQNINPKTLEASTVKFPITIDSFKSAKTQINSNEGYKIKPKIIYSVMLNNICLVIIEKSEENKNNNCLDVSLFDKNDKDIKNLPKEEKEKWVTEIYQYEYENRKAGFKVDGVIDTNEQEIIQKQTVETLNNDFNNITRQAIEDLILEIKSEKPDLQYIYIQTSLRKILKANSYAKPIEQQWENDTEQDKQKLKGEWIQGIYDFQVKHELNPATITYGVIKEQNDPTYQKLKEIVIKQLIVPETVITKGMNQFGTIKNSFENVKNQVYNNLVADQGLREKLTARYGLNAEEINNNNQNPGIIIAIEGEMESLLGRNLWFLFSDYFQDPLDQEYKKEWIEAIYLYQKYKLNFNNPDGVMSPNGKTDQTLIEQITKRIKEKLQQ